MCIRIPKPSKYMEGTMAVNNRVVDQDKAEKILEEIERRADEAIAKDKNGLPR
jgi:ArsR family metal-binding transcriptional regulator